MKHVVLVGTDTSTSALLRAIIFAFVILAKRFAALTVRALKAARCWLITPHKYFAYDGDPIRATGLQVVAAQIIFAAFGLLLSIRW